jgi:hypothetical protein
LTGGWAQHVDAAPRARQRHAATPAQTLAKSRAGPAAELALWKAEARLAIVRCDSVGLVYIVSQGHPINHSLDRDTPVSPLWWTRIIHLWDANREELDVTGG